MSGKLTLGDHKHCYQDTQVTYWPCVLYNYMLLIFLLILKALQEGDSHSDLMVYLLLDALVYSADIFTTISHNPV